MTAFLPIMFALSMAQAGPRPDVEPEARVIENMLIAPCCFQQQVSEHQSSAADEVRRDVRARLAAGQSRQQILDAYVARHGKRVLAQPPAAGFDLTLYVMPVVALLSGAWLLAVVLRRFTKHPLSPPAVSGDLLAFPSAAQVESARLDDELRDLD